MNFLSKQYTNSVQSAFCRIRLKDYFDLLDKADGKQLARSMYNEIKEYTRLDEDCRYCFDAAEKPPYRDDVTVGEMLYAACEMFKDIDRLYKNDSDYCGEGRTLENIARMIVTDILFYPLTNKKILNCLKEHINESKGEITE